MELFDEPDYNIDEINKVGNYTGVNFYKSTKKKMEEMYNKDMAIKYIKSHGGRGSKVKD